MVDQIIVVIYAFISFPCHNTFVTSGSHRHKNKDVKNWSIKNHLKATAKINGLIKCRYLMQISCYYSS